VHMLRLRRRLISVGLTVRTVRSRGYLLERA
jgi:DNA-binding response OmpR family regulator